jgi:small subunit ribosomal protein S17
MDEQMFRLRFQMSMGQMDGLKKYRELKQGPRPDADPCCGSANWPGPAVQEGISSHGRKQQSIGENEKVGEVVSAKMAKTIVVEVTRRVPHPLYKRIVTSARSSTRTTRDAGQGWATRCASSNPPAEPLKRWTLGDRPPRRSGRAAFPPDVKEG